MFDQSLLCVCVVDDYRVCVCASVCVGLRSFDCYMQHSSTLQRKRMDQSAQQLCEDGAAERTQAAIMSFLDPEADQMDNMLPPLHYSTASSGNQI